MALANPEPAKHSAWDIVDRVLEAIIRRIEGSRDIKKKLDYFAKPDPETLSTLSALTPIQAEALAECEWLGSQFNTLEPLAEFAKCYARWSPSKDGKGRETLAAIMISENQAAQHMASVGLPMLPMQGPPEKVSNQKESKGDNKK